MNVDSIISNIKNLTLEDLDLLRISATHECERRERLSQIPSRISDLAKAYLDGGGDENDLTMAVKHPDGEVSGDLGSEEM